MIAGTGGSEVRGGKPGLPAGPETHDLVARRSRPMAVADLVAWGTLAAMTAAALVYCLAFGSSIPTHNTAEFLVPVFSGYRPFALKWLLEDPGYSTLLHKTVMFLIWGLTGRNFMAFQVVNVLLLAGVSALMMIAARIIRGHGAITDAVIPLAFLRLGQSELLLHIGLWESVWVILLAVVLFAIVRQRGVPGSPWSLLAGVAVILLPLNGYLCIAVTPPLIVWLAWLGLPDRQRGIPLITGGGAGLYFS